MTFHDWTDYLLKNRTHFDHIDWKKGTKVSSNERKRIASSIQQFQRGENSEGKSLMNFAKELEDEEYVNTMRIFIREEQRHAMVLGNFMQLNGIDKIRGHWIDNIFRGLRKLASLENSITVLLTAEIIAAVYYKALKSATSSKLLNSICAQILKDEEMHINFQSFTLKKFHTFKSPQQKSLNVAYRKILMAGTVLVVWFSHDKVLKDGKYGIKRFWKECFEEFNRANAMIQGDSNITIRKQLFSFTIKDEVA